MTRRPRTPLDRRDPLTLAIEAYSARFPGHGLPFLRPAGSLEGREGDTAVAPRGGDGPAAGQSGRGGRARLPPAA
jgi:hypothetical protein